MLSRLLPATLLALALCIGPTAASRLRPSLRELRRPALPGYTRPARCSVTKLDLGEANYTCGGMGSYGTTVYLPESEGEFRSAPPFPVVLFHHGKEGWSSDYHDWMYKVASHCIVVVAPQTPEMTGSQNCTGGRDLMIAYGLAMANKDTALKGLADFSRVGAMGHGAGATSLFFFAEYFKLKTSKLLGAAVLSHGGGPAQENGRDMARFSGTHTLWVGAKHDKIISEYWIRRNYTAALSPSKMFVNLANGGHKEPLSTGTLNGYTGLFFACHLGGDQNSCYRYLDVCERVETADITSNGGESVLKNTACEAMVDVNGTYVKIR